MTTAAPLINNTQFSVNVTTKSQEQSLYQSSGAIVAAIVVGVIIIFTVVLLILKTYNRRMRVKRELEPKTTKTAMPPALGQNSNSLSQHPTVTFIPVDIHMQNRCLSASNMPHAFVCARSTPIRREVGWRARPLMAVRSRVTQHSPSRLLTKQSAERARGLGEHYRAASRGLGRCVGRQRWQHRHGPSRAPVVQRSRCLLWGRNGPCSAEEEPELM
ncbi:PREDICTED: noncompact myelin-associated protein [Haliaeetus leucocephalus]|uniref:noncompact myelin-associated protein n=1 Tax=Haliaeetus leucocephalus TaxID=52644 RepID=UPI00053CC262|nr:PREDICTED: noncompact myelin-associated protein [Haliaeetus leucocephalus]